LAAETIREAVGVFHDETSLRDAADDLMIAGFDRAYLSLLASHHAIEEKLGHVYSRVDELEDDPKVPRMAYEAGDSRTEANAALAGGLGYLGALGAAGMIVATGGAIAAAVLGAAVAGGTGGLIGTALSRFLGKQHATHLQEHLDRGGLLLWVRTIDAGHETRATEILKRHGAEDVHVHDLPVETHDDLVGAGMSYDTSFMKRLGL